MQQSDQMPPQFFFIICDDGCDELHMDILKREQSVSLLSRFNVAVIDMWSDQTIVTPAGAKIKIRD